MSRSPDLRLVGFGQDRERARPDADPLLADFLDHVCAPLVGIMPFAERQELRREVQGHLEALIAEYEYQGRSPQEAMRLALQEFGEPWQTGRSVLREWCQGLPQVAPASVTRIAFWRAFGFFSVATMFALLLLEWYLLIDPADFLLSGVVCWALLAPFVAGILTGLAAPARAGRGTAWALGVLLVPSLVTAGILWPSPEGWYFVLAQLFFWLPVGCFCVTATSAIVRNGRRQRFLKYAH